MSFRATISNINRKLFPLVSKSLSPPNLGKIATFVPLKINQLIIERVLNSIFIEQITDGEFDFLQDHLLQIEIIDARLFLGISAKNGKICCTHLSSTSCPSDATLSINSIDSIRLIEQKIDPDTLFFQRKLRIKGNTELAHHAKNTIDTIDLKTIPEFFLKLIDLYKKNILRPAI